MLNYSWNIDSMLPNGNIRPERVKAQFVLIVHSKKYGFLRNSKRFLSSIHGKILLWFRKKGGSVKGKRAQLLYLKSFLKYEDEGEFNWKPPRSRFRPYFFRDLIDKHPLHLLSTTCAHTIIHMYASASTEKKWLEQDPNPRPSDNMSAALPPELCGQS